MRGFVSVCLGYEFSTCEKVPWSLKSSVYPKIILGNEGLNSFISLVVHVPCSLEDYSGDGKTYLPSQNGLSERLSTKMSKWRYFWQFWDLDCLWNYFSCVPSEKHRDEGRDEHNRIQWMHLYLARLQFRGKVYCSLA